MIELYAITDHPGPPLPELAPLRVVPSDRLAAVCAPARSGEVTPDALWRHEEVVEALMRNRDLLPVRYGTRVPDETAAERAVAERYDELSAALDRVRGAVELSLRVLVEQEDAPPAGASRSGADYLRVRSRAEAEREAVLRTVHDPLSILARASRRTSSGSSSELLRAAYLVDRAGVEGFTALVARLQEANPRLRLLCTGPWPPYTFAAP